MDPSGQINVSDPSAVLNPLQFDFYPQSSGVYMFTAYFPGAVPVYDKRDLECVVSELCIIISIDIN
jgi:hypothetical protein